jgi:transposase
MPWKECSVMDERLRFVARLLDGEAMSEVCRAFGISRKTGYKIFERYKEHGLEALTDRSRRPVRYANQLPRQIESLIVVAKRDKPHWGARKIRELLVRRFQEPALAKAGGEFKLGNGRYCFPLTVSGHARAISCSAKPLNQPARTSPSRPSSSSSRSAAYRRRSGPTTACRSPVQTASSISPNSRCGGSGSASPSSASGLAIHSRTAATSACI